MNMQTTDKTSITVSATILAPVAKVWTLWTTPEHITTWNSASADWHTPYAENDLRVGGKFLSRMAARDGSMSFDFEGVYAEVEDLQKIAYTIADGRKVAVIFEAQGDSTLVTETFEAENIHAVELQQAGWQAILDNFKRYAENLA